MDFHVTSKQEQRGILTGLLLGRAHRQQRNFVVQHRQPLPEVIALKQTLLAQITRQTVGCRQWRTRQGEVMMQLMPKLIPLSRVLVQRLYHGDRKVVTPRFLVGLTLPGIALWFLDRGTRQYRHRAGKITGVSLRLHPQTAESETIAIATYFAQTWGINWGLVRDRDRYALRVGIQGSRAFFAQIAPYLPPTVYPLLDPSHDRTATT